MQERLGHHNAPAAVNETYVSVYSALHDPEAGRLPARHPSLQHDALVDSRRIMPRAKVYIRSHGMSASSPESKHAERPSEASPAAFQVKYGCSQRCTRNLHAWRQPSVGCKGREWMAGGGWGRSCWCRPKQRCPSVQCWTRMPLNHWSASTHACCHVAHMVSHLLHTICTQMVFRHRTSHDLLPAHLQFWSASCAAWKCKQLQGSLTQCKD